MADTATIEWPGQSGKKYLHYIYPIGTGFQARGGNYIFCKLNAQGLWVPVYIGQTGDLESRFANHHATPCINRNEATHVHVHANDNEHSRLNEESDLLSKFNTFCNISQN